MALRFTLTQYSAVPPKDGNSYVPFFNVYIYDSEYSGEPTSLDGNFTIKNHSTNIEKPLEPILRSSANITITVREIDSAFETFLSEIVGSDEMRFTVEIYRNTGNKIFRGHLVTDIITIPDQYYPFDVQLYASDGLNRLKNIEYRDINDNPYSGKATIIQHFINVIKKIGFSYGIEDPIIKTYGFNWIADSQVLTDARLDKIRCNHNVWQEYETYPAIKCASCYQVLNDILVSFNARIFQSDGVFIIQQINSFSSSPLCVWKHDGTLISSDSFNRNIALSDNRTDGEYSFLPAIREASTSFGYKYSLNKNSNLYPFPYPIGQSVYLGYFTGENNQFIINLRIRSDFKFEVGENLQVFAKYGLDLKAEDELYLAGRYSTYFGEIPISWDNAPNSYQIFTQPAPVGNYPSHYTQLEIITPAFNIEADFYLYFNFIGLFSNPDQQITITPDKFSFSIENFQVIQLQGSVTGNSGNLQYKGINNKSDGITPITSTVVTELENSPLGDGPQPFCVSKLEVQNSFGFWVPSVAWKPSTTYNGDSMPLHKLRLFEYLSLNKTAIKLFEFVYLDFIKQYQALTFKGETYLIVNWELDPEWDSIKVVGWKINQDRTNIQLLDAVNIQEHSGAGSGINGYGNPSNSTHVKLHSIDSELDHTPALEADWNKLVATNATTGAIEFIPKIAQWWQRIIATGQRTKVSPATDGDDIDSLTGFLVGAIKATKILAKTDSATAIQITKADGSTIILNLDTNAQKAKLIAGLSVCPGADNTPSSTLDIAGSIGIMHRICTGANGSTGVNITMQDTESVYSTDTRNGIVKINLTSANSASRRIVWIRQLNDNQSLNYGTQINAYGTEQIYTKSGDTASILMGSNGQWVMLQSIMINGTTWKWYVVSSSGNW